MAKKAAAPKAASNLFASAANRASDNNKKPTSKGTTWTVTGALSESLDEVVALQEQIDVLDTKKKIEQDSLKDFAYDNFLADFAKSGIMPPTPMKIVNANGRSVTFVVQDKSNSYKVGDASLAQLESVLGNKLDTVVGEQTIFSFNSELMAIPGVADKINEHLQNAISELTLDKILTDDQAVGLIECTKQRGFLVEGVVSKAATIVGANTLKIRSLLDAMAGACVKFVRL